MFCFCACADPLPAVIIILEIYLAPKSFFNRHTILGLMIQGYNVVPALLSAVSLIHQHGFFPNLY